MAASYRAGAMGPCVGSPVYIDIVKETIVRTSIHVDTVDVSAKYIIQYSE